MTSSKLKLSFSDFHAEAELFPCKTSESILKILPISGSSQRWGEEIYFPIPMHAEKEKSASDVVPMGSLAFWPEGNCFCIFFGPTPASRQGEIRAASAVNIFGRVAKGIERLSSVKEGEKVLIEKME